jgi:hypothetical protein
MTCHLNFVIEERKLQLLFCSGTEDGKWTKQAILLMLEEY